MKKPNLTIPKNIIENKEFFDNDEYNKLIDYLDEGNKQNVTINVPSNLKNLNRLFK